MRAGRGGGSEWLQQLAQTTTARSFGRRTSYQGTCNHDCGLIRAIKSCQAFTSKLTARQHSIQLDAMNQFVIAFFWTGIQEHCRNDTDVPHIGHT